MRDSGVRLPRIIRLIGAVGFIGTLVGLAVITLKPTTVDHDIGTQIGWFLYALRRLGLGWFGYDKLQFSANIAGLVPLGVFLAMLLPGGRRWIGALVLPCLSAAIECGQFLFLPGRFASIFDVVANSIGAWIGLAVVSVAAAVAGRSTVPLQPSGAGRG